MAFRDITKLSNNIERKYVEQFMKMRLKRFGIQKIREMIKYKENRVNYRYLILKKNNLTVSQFYEKLFHIIDASHRGLSSLSRRLDRIYPAIYNLSSKGIKNLEMSKDSRDMTYRTLNLINIIRHLKYRVEIKGR
jgi:predicted transcriptional regulator